MSGVLAPVARHAATAPQTTAVVDSRGEVTYGQLWAYAGHYAARLAELGVGSGDYVAIAAGRSAEFVVGVLAILRQGAAYVPLDTSYPAERIRTMIEVSGAQVLVLGPDAAVPDGLRDLQPLVVDVQQTDVQQDPPSGGPDPLAGDGDCYLMFTSGSTGVPKGVRHGPDSLTNLLTWQAGASACGPGDRTALYAPTSFDVSFQEMFATLGTGGTLICIDHAARTDPDMLWQAIVNHGIQRLFLPAVALQLLAEFAPDSIGSQVRLAEIITAGEQLVVTPRLRWLFRRLGDCQLANQYGPTETHVVTEHVLGPDPRKWPALPAIGRPIAGVAVHLLDNDLDPVPEGSLGQIAVVGKALSRGYLNRADETTRLFRRLREPASLAYLTGDFGRVGEDGELHFGGRRDDQVKIQGYRIECGEVEAALLSIESVRSCVVRPVGTGPMERELEALIVPTRLDPVDLATIRGELAQRLPAYAVPAQIQWVQALPLTPSGKVDRTRATRED